MTDPMKAREGALVEALKLARDYVVAVLADQRATFADYEHCSDIASIERDLASIEAALALPAGAVGEDSVQELANELREIPGNPFSTIIDEIADRLSASRLGVAQGEDERWAIVPREATASMVMRGSHWFERCLCELNTVEDAVERAWEAMVDEALDYNGSQDATPAAPRGVSGEAVVTDAMLKIAFDHLDKCYWPIEPEDARDLRDAMNAALRGA